MRLLFGGAALISVWFASVATAPARAYTINATETGKRIRWASSAISVQMDPALDAFLNPGDAYAALMIGLEAWRGLPHVPDLTLEPGSPSAQPGYRSKRASNGIYLLRHWPYEQSKLAITVVTYEMQTGRLLDADVLVNGDARYGLLPENASARTLNAANTYDLASVLTHEVGHMLGLGESAAGPSATMWPYAQPGQTSKRTLADDDEQGAIDNYLGAAPARASGCAAVSMAANPSTKTGWFIGALLAMTALASARLRRTRVGLASTATLALTMLCGYGDSAELSMEVLAKHATRDQRSLLEELGSSADSRVAAQAQQLLASALGREPEARVHISDAQASLRVRSLLGDRADARTLQTGRAQRLQVIDVQGMLFTEYDVVSRSGTRTRLRVPGGVQGSIGQRVLDSEPPPADGQSVAIVPQSDGQMRWAYVQGDRVFGGHLGDGPAIVGLL